MADDYVPPKYRAESFHCLHCNVYAHQDFTQMIIPVFNGSQIIPNYDISICSHCKNITIWLFNSIEHKVIFPPISRAPLPDAHMPDDIKEDYNEARCISHNSPRSALMLLRFCLEKICENREAAGKTLYDKIDALVKKEHLDNVVEDTLASVRIIGNDATHSTEISYTEDEIILVFGVINYISDRIYGEQAKINRIGALAKSKKK